MGNDQNLSHTSSKTQNLSQSIENKPPKSHNCFKPQFIYIPKRNGEEDINEDSSDQQKQKQDEILQLLEFTMEEEYCPFEFKRVQDRLKWNEFMKLKNGNYLQNYIVKQRLGKGGFGQVVKVMNKLTKIQFAAKRVQKNEIPLLDKKRLFSQMAILNQLDHPYIIKLIEVYDYMQRYILIQEYMQESMNLQKFVRQKGNKLDQKQLIPIMKQIFQALNYLHNKNIVHRDIKCQNILIEPHQNSIKIIDFGSATFYFQKLLKKKVGTPRYNAPQLIMNKYSNKVDLWSCGILMYRLLSGFFPFKGNIDVIEKRICEDSLKFDHEIWRNISPQCLDLVKCLLEKNPQKRISLERCLNHRWIKQQQQIYDFVFEEIIMKRMANFKFVNSLQALVNTYIISHLLKASEKRELNTIFHRIDHKNVGIITKKELQGSLRRYFTNYKSKADEIMKMLDLNKSGTIDYTQFLVGCIKPSTYNTIENLENAFHFFDIDHSGAITIEEISIFLEGQTESRENIRVLFDLVDENKDGYISKQQFVKLLSNIMDSSQVNRYKTQNFFDDLSFSKSLKMGQ